MEFQSLTLSRQDGVARLTLNRPDKHNAFGDTMISELNQALVQLAKAPPRVLVLAANGKHFSAGADLVWMKSQVSQDEQSNLRDARELARLMHSLDRFPCPTLALVNGAAFGGALGLIACCDIALASPQARFCLSEVKLGLIPAVISPFVARAVGQRQARRYMLSAESFDADTACRLGLVHQVCDDLNAAGQHMIATLISNGPKAIQACKALLHTIERHPLDDALAQLTAEAIARIRVSEEGQEGLDAFFDKRPPCWQGEQ